VGRDRKVGGECSCDGFTRAVLVRLAISAFLTAKQDSSQRDVPEYLFIPSWSLPAYTPDSMFGRTVVEVLDYLLRLE
jgi:hypothetical protein